MSERAEFKRWDTPTGLPPIVIRYGDYAWQTQVKVGDQWLATEYVRVEYSSHRGRYGTVTLSLPGHLTFERVELTEKDRAREVEAELDG